MIKKLFFVLAFALLPLGGWAQSSLPSCSGGHFDTTVLRQNYDNRTLCFGSRSYPGGQSYVGEFRGRDFHGFGTYTSTDGTKHVGWFDSDRRSGEGIEYHANGSVNRSGQWSEGNLVRPYVLDTSRFPFDLTQVALTQPTIEGRYLGSTLHSTLEGEITGGFLVLKFFGTNRLSFSCTDKDSGVYGPETRLQVDVYGTFSGRCMFGPGEGVASGGFPVLSFSPSPGSNLRGFNITLKEDPSDSRHVLRREARRIAEERRLEEEKKLAETEHVEKERQKLEQARLAEEKRLADQKRIAEETRLAEERQLAEAKRVPDTKRAEEDRGAKDALQREQNVANELREMREQLQALQKKTQTPTSASANSRRLALVIGNDAYQAVPKLLNARADARAMAKQLEATGFKVTLLFDLTERTMKDALRTFRTSVEGGDEVIVFFAGHGVQLGAANYLLPVDIRGDSEEQVKDEAIPLQRILDDLSERKARFSLAIVDACRDNPFKGSGRAIGGRGLAPAAAASGQMVIFSAGTGQQALDRLGDKDKDPNGLFTRIFLREMAKPGVPIDRVVRTVRNAVVQMAKSVGHEQVPALYDQTLGDFYFIR